MAIFTLTNLTLLVALALSSISAWYSILGLTAIFAAASTPIIIMGGTLELAKVVTTVWLHKYWIKIKLSMKLYLIVAVLGLALLTSIGVFGFLSKAHVDQGLPTGDVAAKIAIIDEKIKIQRENIEAARSALAQMDAQVNARLDRGATEQGAERAVQIRRQQVGERNKLLKEISDAQANITKLNEERAPIAAEYRKVEAEVGPIKYIAALIYDDNTNQDTLERAVRWLILLIVLVFDPLALMLVLAANASREWDKNDDAEIVEEVEIMKHEETTQAPVTEPVTEVKDDFDISKHSYLFKPWANFKSKEKHFPNPPVENVVIEEKVVEPEVADTLPLDDVYTTLPGGYVVYKGKHMSLSALRDMHPELFLVTDFPPKNTDIDFSSGFPKNAKKNETHVRTDMTPNRVFVFNGEKWVETNTK